MDNFRECMRLTEAIRKGHRLYFQVVDVELFPGRMLPVLKVNIEFKRKENDSPTQPL